MNYINQEKVQNIDILVNTKFLQYLRIRRKQCRKGKIS